MAQQPQQVYQFHIELLEVKPAIWRRIQVSNITMNKLHQCIQTAMGWTNSHLHEFIVKGARYADPQLVSNRWEEDVDNEHNTRLVHLSDLLLLAEKGFVFEYVYDFGDYWQHKVTFEGTIARRPKTKYPICIDGARACPPEDVGSIPGYQELIEALADPLHQEHNRMREWVGDSYDPAHFSVVEATKAMQIGLPDWRLMDDDNS
jgi:hypothetical protein